MTGRLTGAFTPAMKARGWGRIGNMTSNSVGLVIPGFTHYIAAKMAVIGLTRGRGVTWARIGAALQITRQSAWERFSGEE